MLLWASLSVLLWGRDCLLPPLCLVPLPSSPSFTSSEAGQICRHIQWQSLWCFLHRSKSWSILGFKISHLTKVSKQSSGGLCQGTMSRALAPDPFSGWIPKDARPCFLGWCAVLQYQSWTMWFRPAQPATWLGTSPWLQFTCVALLSEYILCCSSLINFHYSHKRKLELSLPFLAAEGSWLTVSGVRDVGG